MHFTKRHILASIKLAKRGIPEGIIWSILSRSVWEKPKHKPRNFPRARACCSNYQGVMCKHLAKKNLTDEQFNKIQFRTGSVRGYGEWCVEHEYQMYSLLEMQAHAQCIKVEI